MNSKNKNVLYILYIITFHTFSLLRVTYENFILVYINPDFTTIMLQPYHNIIVQSYHSYTQDMYDVPTLYMINLSFENPMEFNLYF